MQTREFNLTGAQGQTLSGRLELPDGPVRAYALFAHCFTCTKKSVAAVRITRALAARGFGVLRYDFTGLGDSAGDFADSTFSADVQDIVAAGRIMADAGMAPRLLIGHSLGGAAVLAAALDMPDIAAVATIAAPFDVEHVTGQFGASLAEIIEKGEAKVDLGGRPFTVRKSFVDDLHRHDQKDRIGRLHKALLVLHAPQDLTVGINNAGSIFTAAKHPKSFVSLDGADHLLTRPADADYAAEVIAAWASRYLGSAAKPTADAEAAAGVVVEETRAGKYQVVVRAPGTAFFADEPVAAGGMGTGPSPYDLLGAGLGACTAMTLRMYADQKGLPLGRVRVAVSHAKAKDQTPADVFTRRIALEGEGLTAEQHARLLEIADRCPVHRTLERGAAIRTEAAPGPAGEGGAGAGAHARDMQAVCDNC
jgi:uncharacterized OsmC-like protein/alpha-beta hydrolase superfamily lysophospholipase